MKTRNSSNSIPLLALILLQLGRNSAEAQPTPPLTYRSTSGGLELSWPATQRSADGSVNRPIFELQRSSDLRHWRPWGERQRSLTASSSAVLGANVPLDERLGFFRLWSIESPRAAKLGQGGAEVFGYGDAFQQHLEQIGQITPDQFGAMFLAGPVLSHYEFEVMGDPRRLSDQEWGGAGSTSAGLGFSPGVLQGAFPKDVPRSRIEGLKPPVWTQSYLAR